MNANRNHFILGSALIVAVNIGIIIHSWVIHGSVFKRRRKPKHWFSSEVKTEMAAWWTALMVVFVFVAYIIPGRIAYVVCFNLLRSGIAGVIVQLCDSYMFFDRLRVASSSAGRPMSQIKVWVIHLYIWLILILPWAPAYSLIPFFYDVNSRSFQAYYYGVGLRLYVMGAFTYNFYISLESTFLIRSIMRSASAISDEHKTSLAPRRILSSMESIARRNIAHALTSSGAMLVYLLAPEPWASGTYGTIIPLGMHIWFNIPYWSKKHTNPKSIYPMNRMIREIAVINRRMSSIVRIIRAHEDRVQQQQQLQLELNSNTQS